LVESITGERPLTNGETKNDETRFDQLPKRFDGQRAAGRDLLKRVIHRNSLTLRDRVAEFGA
jgi:hypothetical protein